MAIENPGPNDGSGGTSMDQLWAQASNALNTYADTQQGAGQSGINWDAAKKLFEQYAATGQGNINDWVNQVVAQKSQWLGNSAPAAGSGTGGATGSGTGPRYQGGGVDLGKWNDPKHTSAKYQVLRILDQIPPAEARAQLKAGSGAIVDQLKALGFTITNDDSIQRADLGTIDVIHGGDKEYGWRVNGAKTPPIKTVSPPGIAPGGVGTISPPGPGNLPDPRTVTPAPGGKAGIDPAYLAPWTEAFQGVAPLPAWSYENFQAPDPDSVYADKGYQFRTQQGLKGLQAGVASTGNLRTGGTLKGLIDYGQASASQEYGNVYNRAMTDYTTNRSTSQGKYDTLAAQNSANYARALADYQQRYAIFRNNQNDPWAKLQDLARLGQQSAATR